MSRYSVALTRQALTSRHPAIAPSARKTVTIATKRICSQPEQSDNSDEQTKKLRRKIEKLRTQKKLLLYSRPILTVAGVAATNYVASRLGLSQPELITSLMVLATTNTIAYHKADEWHSAEIKAAQKTLDELD
ncbi:hypothetical protein ACFLXW_00270 [Candidatus Dependentiae bacterium]